MNLDSLITVAGLFVAVYAVVPRVRKLEFSLKFGAIGWLLLIAAVGAVLYLQFYQTFRVLGLTPGLQWARWGLTPSNVSFLVLLVAAGAIFVYMRMRGLARSNIGRFYEFVLELSREKRYSELCSLIENNLAKLARIYHGRLALSRARHRLEEMSNPTRRALARIRGDSLPRELSRPVQVLCSRIAHWLPAYESERGMAGDTVHEVLLNRKTVRGVIESRPYFPISLYAYDFNEFHDFFNTYLTLLLVDNESILYHELKNNQNISSTFQYDIPSRNRLLRFLFGDCNVANSLGPYRPVGEAVILELEKLNSDDGYDQYDGPMRDFDEDGKWESMLFVGIRFFDLMVSSALHQNITWHMWLYYFSEFAERMVRNLDSNPPSADLEGLEYPTQYHYLLSEIVSCMCHWIEAIEHLSVDQENVRLVSERATHENGNIPKSAMLALGRVLREILLGNRVGDRFKSQMTEIVFRRYFSLKAAPRTNKYAVAMLNALRCGGFEMLGPKNGYSNALLSNFRTIDRIPYESSLVTEVDSALARDAAKSV